jgi:hypothetical protein
VGVPHAPLSLNKENLLIVGQRIKPKVGNRVAIGRLIGNIGKTGVLSGVRIIQMDFYTLQKKKKRVKTLINNFQRKTLANFFFSTKTQKITQPTLEGTGSKKGLPLPYRRRKEPLKNTVIDRTSSSYSLYNSKGIGGSL